MVLFCGDSNQEFTVCHDLLDTVHRKSAPSSGSVLKWCPDQDLNLDSRFRKPQLCPFELSGRGG